MHVSITFAYYEIDPIGFIEKLCENKDKPELACNGKCQLKKVAESNSTDNNTTPNIRDLNELVLFHESPSIIVLKTDFGIYFQNYNYQDLYSYFNLSDCFHPPQQLFT